MQVEATSHLLPAATQNMACVAYQAEATGTPFGSTPGGVSFVHLIKRSASLVAEALQFQRENSPQLSALGKPQIG